MSSQIEVTKPYQDPCTCFICICIFASICGLECNQDLQEVQQATRKGLRLPPAALEPWGKASYYRHAKNNNNITCWCVCM